MDKNEKEKLYKKELTKLNRIFKSLSPEQQQLFEGLKLQAAFMFATLAELQSTINKDGSVELFINGKQQMLREHPPTKTYNTMIRNYANVCKQLFDLLPNSNDKQ